MPDSRLYAKLSYLDVGSYLPFRCESDRKSSHLTLNKKMNRFSKIKLFFCVIFMETAADFPEAEILSVVNDRVAQLQFQGSEFQWA